MNQIVSQDSMQRALDEYFASLKTIQQGTFNAMLDPQLISCSFREKKLQTAVLLQSWMVNPSGNMHGGIAASVLDFTMGILSRMCNDGKLTPTVTMTIDYIRSSKAGKRLIVEAECIKHGNHLSYITAKAWNEDAPDKQILSASGTYFTGLN